MVNLIAYIIMYWLFFRNICENCIINVYSDLIIKLGFVIFFLKKCNEMK